MSMDNKAVQLALLSRANTRAEQRQLNVPLSERLAGHSFSGGVSGGAATVSHPIGQTRNIRGKGRDGRVVADKLPLTPDRPALAMDGRGGGSGKHFRDQFQGGMKRQGRKSREDEKLAMEVKGLKDEEDEEDMEGGGLFSDVMDKMSPLGKMAKRGRGTLEIRHHGGAKKAHDMGMKYMKALMEADPELAELHGAGIFDKFLDGAKTFAKGFAMPVKVAADITGIPPLKAAKAGLTAVGLGKGRKGRKNMEDMVEVDKVEDEIGVGGARRRTRKASAPSSSRRARGAMVSKLMREHGMSLGQASKYIKEHGMK